jgi:hypothetical protein
VDKSIKALYTLKFRNLAKGENTRPAKTRVRPENAREQSTLWCEYACLKCGRPVKTREQSTLRGKIASRVCWSLVSEHEGSAHWVPLEYLMRVSDANIRERSTVLH